MFTKITILLNSYKDYLRDYLVNKPFTRFMPYNPLHDDLYIVSFPKSGTTWLNFIMANVHLKMSGREQQVSFYNIADFIPDIMQNRYLKNDILAFPGHRVIKSHAEMNPLYTKIIYLIRDPRDVMVSYYWFLKMLGGWNEDLHHLIHSRAYGIEAWCRHIQGWVERTSVANRIDFIRYEDMKVDPLQVVTRIYTRLGQRVPEEILKQAIELSSFENMQKLEAEYNHGGDFRFPGFKFFRKGKSGDYRTEISDGDLKFINEKASRWLSMFNYSVEL
jgi:Sulfotransferase domain